jgi:putative ABC transport system permease protein
MNNLIQDVCYGLRLLRKDLGFTLVAVVALALGIGANSAIFCSIHAMLIQPLPFRSLSSIVALWETAPHQNRVRSRVAPSDFFDWQAQTKAFRQMAAYQGINLNLTGVDDPESLRAYAVSRDYFALLGVQPRLGRLFTEDDFRVGQSRSVLLSYGFWQRRLASDPLCTAKKIFLNGAEYSIAGVIPEDYDYPLGADAWTPLAFTPQQQQDRDSQTLSVVGLLAPDVPQSRAQAEMTTIAARLERQYPLSNAGRGVEMGLLRDFDGGVTRHFVLILLAASLFVLLLACANVANLQLARAVSRRREVAIRMAMGAGRLRIVAQMLTESLVLAAAGAGVGLLLAMWGNDLMIAAVPADVMKFIPGLKHVRVDWFVVAMTAAVAVTAGLVSGVAPALQASCASLNEALKEGGRTSSAGSARSRLRSLLVLAEVSLALVLLVGAGLMVQTFQKLAEPKLGYEFRNLLSMHVTLPESKYRDDRHVAAFFEQALGKMAAVSGGGLRLDGAAAPALRESAFSTGLPALQHAGNSRFVIEGRPAPAPGEQPSAEFEIVSESFFSVLRIPMLRGRSFSAADGPDTLPVAILSRTAAERYWHGLDSALGHKLKLFGASKSLTLDGASGSQDGERWVTVAGIAEDLSDDWFFGRTNAIVYLPFRQAPRRSMYLLSRIGGESAAITAAREQFRSIDADQPISGIDMLEKSLSDAMSGVRAGAQMMTVNALIALLLSAAGVYAVMAYSVTQRTHEFGVRMALGARSGDVLRMVLGQSLRTVLVGLGVGLTAAIALGWAMSAALYGLVPLNPLTFVAVALLLAAVSAAAGLIPARRAAGVDPIVALRYE